VDEASMVRTTPPPNTKSVKMHESFRMETSWRARASNPARTDQRPTSRACRRRKKRRARGDRRGPMFALDSATGPLRGQRHETGAANTNPERSGVCVLRCRSRVACGRRRRPPVAPVCRERKCALRVSAVSARSAFIVV